MTFTYENIELTNKFYFYFFHKDFIRALEKDTNRLFNFDIIDKKYKEEKSLNNLMVLDPALLGRFEMCVYDNKLIFISEYNNLYPAVCKITMCNSDFTDYKQLTHNFPKARKFLFKARKLFFSVIYGNYLYIGFGISANSIPLNDIWRFDLINKEWIKLEYESECDILPRYFFSYKLVNDNVYIFGGEDFKLNYMRFNEVFVFNITSNYLRKIKVPSYVNMGIAGSACDYYNDHIYVYGGLITDELSKQKSYFFKNIIKFNIYSEKFETHILENNVYNSFKVNLKILNGQMYVFPNCIISNGNSSNNNLLIIKVDNTKCQLNQINKIFKNKEQQNYCDLNFVF